MMTTLTAGRSATFARKLRIEPLEDRLVLSADFNGDNTVDALDLQIWEDNYGTVNTATQPQGDFDGDSDVDGADFLAWQRDFGNIILVAPRNVEARAVRATSIEVTWDVSLNATDYLVARRNPATETFFTAIAPNVVGTSYTDTGLSSDTLYEYLVVAQANPSSDPSQVVQATTNRANLTAYRPQGVYDPDDNSTPNPIYDPFPRRPVKEVDEGHSDNGPGIRINSDDDDNNGTSDRFQTGSAITRENDLIEVKIDRLPGQGDMVLTKNSQLSLFFDHDKETLVPLDAVGTTTLPLPFVNDTVTIWVEWTSTTHGPPLPRPPSALAASNDSECAFTDEMMHYRPDVAFYLLSIYQTNSFLRGGDIDDSEVLPGATLEEINTTSDPGWTNTLSHSQIDDDVQVGSLIITRLDQLLLER